MTGAADEGRLELGDDGSVVGPSAAATTVVDLHDPAATDTLRQSALDSWVAGTAGPWVRAHRRPVVAVTACAVVLALGAGWWVSRPPPPPPAPLLTLADRPVLGVDSVGPRMVAGGHLSVAYAARASADEARLDVVGLRGPGLRSAGVEQGADTVVAGELAFVQLGAQIVCADRTLATATASSYGVLVRRPGALPGDDVLVAMDGSTTDLGAAVRGACLASELPKAVSVLSADVTGPTGSSVVDLSLRVLNDADVPLTVTTRRVPSTTVETDLSGTVMIAPHTAGTVTTRLLLHDCSAAARPGALAELPNPVIPPGYAVPAPDAGGVTLRLGLGTESTIASYALPWSVAQLSERLTSLGCTGAPTVSAQLVDVVGSRSIDGSWLVTGSYDVRTSGIGVTLGREHFTGPPAGQGSSLATTDSTVPGVRWVLAPTQLDGGAGRLPVTFSGISCDDRDRGVPTSMAVRVTTADRFAYPFELPLDPATLRDAVDTACSPASTVTVPGWGEVTPGSTPAS